MFKPRGAEFYVRNCLESSLFLCAHTIEAIVIFFWQFDKQYLFLKLEFLINLFMQLCQLILILITGLSKWNWFNLQQRKNKEHSVAFGLKAFLHISRKTFLFGPGHAQFFCDLLFCGRPFSCYALHWCVTWFLAIYKRGQA